jgi:hypothetical protein
MLLVVALSGSCFDSTDQTRKRTLNEISAYHVFLVDGMRSAAKSDSVASFDNTTGDSAAISWRLVLVLGHTAWESGVRVDPTIPWDSEYYASVDREFDNRAFRVPVHTKSDGKCNLFAVVGAGTAFTSLQDGDETNIRGDSILLMDADLGDVHWMSPVDIDGPSIEQRPDTMPPPATADGRYVAFADGVVMLLSSDVPNKLLAKFISADPATPRNRERDLGPFVLDRVDSSLSRPIGSVVGGPDSRERKTPTAG